MMLPRALALAVALALVWSTVGLVPAAETGFDRVTHHTAVFTRPPSHVPTQGMPDGPLLGNGDLGVTLGGPPESQQFHIGKNDFWRRTPADASIMAVGVVTLGFPALRGASYHQETDLARAEVRGVFAGNGSTLTTRSWVDAHENLLVIALRWEGTSPLEFTVTPTPGPLSTNGPTKDGVAAGAGAPGTTWFTRKADALPGRCREAAVVARCLGATARNLAEGGFTASAKPGESAIVAVSVLSDLDSADALAAARQRVDALTPMGVEELAVGHRKWWSEFWGRSFVTIPDQEIEKRWYAALYVLGSCSRAGKVAPGLWGSWVTTDRPNWHGDFHLNYNFQAPYYIAYSANHADLSLPFYQAIRESLPNGRAMARRHGWKGVHFPVCIGPWGLSPEDPDGDWGQRSDAAFAALNFIWHYQYTQDPQFLRDVAYPYLLEVAEFWEDYLKLEEGRYVILNDSIHEGSGADMNPVLSLGLVRTLFRNLIRQSEDLGVDVPRRTKWRDIVARISAFPVQERAGKTVFRYSEKGTAWVNDNTLGIHHIFPAGALGLDTDPALLEVSRNTITVMNRWHDNNGFASWYTACARVGYDPSIILANLRRECDARSYPNLVLNYGGGGIENVAGFLAVNEMLLQGHEGVLRFFPVWPKDQDARFGSLRTVGAFLVSAELKGGVVGGVRIRSERGRSCTVQNPWPGRGVQLVRDGIVEPTGPRSGDRFTFPTQPNEEIELQPR